MESPLRGDTHGGFGERPGETDQQQCRHRAPGRLIRAALVGSVPGVGLALGGVLSTSLDVFYQLSMFMTQLS